jgi:hypothetical protein
VQGAVRSRFNGRDAPATAHGIDGRFKRRSERACAPRKEAGMTETMGTIRELSVEEMALVSGAFSWEDLGQAMLVGALTGAMAGSITPAGPVLGAIGGGLIAGAAYCFNDILNYFMAACF